MHDVQLPYDLLTDCRLRLDVDDLPTTVSLSTFGAMQSAMKAASISAS